MYIKTIASAALLVSTLGFGGIAYAQSTMIGNQAVSEADMERVKNYCEDLKTADEQTAGSPEADAAMTSSDGEPDKIGAVDIDAITLENCIEAGFVEG